MQVFLQIGAFSLQTDGSDKSKALFLCLTKYFQITDVSSRTQVFQFMEAQRERLDLRLQHGGQRGTTASR